MLKIIACIIGYNRDGHILSTIETLKKNKNSTRIIVSLDNSPYQNSLHHVIHNTYPDVEIILHKKRKGLKSHVLACGDLILDSEHNLILLLEDDIILSEQYHQYLDACNDIINDDNNIAGISLYSYDVDEAYLLPFKPKEDGYDNYYMKFASSWGIAFNSRQWCDFKTWLNINDCLKFSDSNVPEYVCNWPTTSWKKHFTRYLIQENKYFLYPRISLCNNPGLDGENHKNIGNIFSVNILDGEKKWNLSNTVNSKVVIDEWFGFEHYKNKKISKYQQSVIRYNATPLGIKDYLALLLLSLIKRVL